MIEQEGSLVEMTSQTKLWALSAGALALSLALAGCGGGGSSSGPAAATDTTPPPQVGETPTPTPSAPQPVSASGMVTLPAAAMVSFLAILDEPGDSDSIAIAAGETEEREGVTFSCDSAYDCVVTVTNNLGTILATWSSEALPDAMAGVMASVPYVHVPVDTFANLNAATPGLAATSGSFRNLVTTPTLTPTELTGMGFGDSGVLNADMAGLRSSFDPNSPAVVGAAADTMGAANVLTGGSTLSGATDGIGASEPTWRRRLPDGR